MNELRDHQFLTFSLDGGTFAIPIARVREVLRKEKITKLPNAKDYMKGIINLRGGSVPVVDLRTRFGMNEAEETKQTAIIVLDVAGPHGDEIMGVIADAVHEVVIIDDDSMEAPPCIGTKVNTNFITHIGKKDGEFAIVLDMDAAISYETAYGS
jgi:purine-binding chemotaxis protein CheW